jgi:hypothetical protein
MPKFETKKLFSILIFGFALVTLARLVLAADYNSSNFTVKDSVVDQGSSTVSSSSFGLGQSFGQLAVGRSTSGSFQLWSGFQYYFKVDANVLSAVPGAANGEVDLSWTVPQTFLGITVAGYEVGTGTVSGSYTFQNVGNVTSFTKSGLTPGQQYYFKVKTLSPGNVFLVFSNEATATATGAPVPPPPPPSGGGGGGVGNYNANLSVSGVAYPNSVVTLLKDGQIIATTTSNPSGQFSFYQNNLNGGTYNFSLYAMDANNELSPSLNFIQTLTGSTTTAVDNLIIGPTIKLSHTAAKQGETVSVVGFAAPASQVALTLTGPVGKTFQVNSGQNGSYAFTLNTADLSKGEYDVFTRVKVGNDFSSTSLIKKFTVGDANVVTPPGECKRSDFNCDGKVNLVDFSIMLYFWDSTEFSKNPSVDIDKSGRVGLRDLSIMLYDWTG